MGFKIVSLKNSIRRYPCGENSISRCGGKCAGTDMENSIRLVSGDIHAQQVSVREIVSAAICLYPDISLSVCGSWFTETIFEVILFSVLLVIPFLLFFFTPACFTTERLLSCCTLLELWKAGIGKFCVVFLAEGFLSVRKLVSN